MAIAYKAILQLGFNVGGKMHTENEVAMLFDRKVVVDCPPFSENNGGAIVLHMLVDRLRSLGVDAYAIELEADYSNVKSSFVKKIKRWNRRRRLGSFKTHPSMNVPLTNEDLLDDAVVVYPETRSGNPLHATRVVRWLLHKPGFFGIDLKIEEEEEVFYYQEAFIKGIPNIPADRLLQVRWIRDDIYQNWGGQRTGSCRMLRKGKYSGAKVPQLDKAISLDGKTHTEIAQIFNTTELFYCHDLYTTYSYYAVLCGCVPVIVPLPGLSAAAWRAGVEFKYGVAYGDDEIEWARATRDMLIADMASAKIADTGTVLNFLTTLQAKFP